MKKINYRFYIIIVFFFTFLVNIQNAYASWNFANIRVANVSDIIAIGISKWDLLWDGAEALPTEDEGNQLVFLDRIIYDDNIGVNNNNSAINQNLQSRLEGSFFGFGKKDYYSSVDNNQNGVSDLIGDEKNITFAVEAVNGINNNNYTRMYIYTTEINLGQRGSSTGLIFPTTTVPGSPTIPIGEYIYPIFRTTLDRIDANSDWVVKESIRGMAPSNWYSGDHLLNPQAEQIPCFDLKNWKAGILGDTVNKPINTFVGDDPSIEFSISGNPIYYKVSSFGGNCTIWSENLNIEFKVKENNTIIAESTIINDKNTLSFVGNSNSQYTIEVYGSEDTKIYITSE